MVLSICSAGHVACGWVEWGVMDAMCLLFVCAAALLVFSRREFKKAFVVFMMCFCVTFDICKDGGTNFPDVVAADRLSFHFSFFSPLLFLFHFFLLSFLFSRCLCILFDFDLFPFRVYQLHLFILNFSLHILYSAYLPLVDSQQSLFTHTPLSCFFSFFSPHHSHLFISSQAPWLTTSSQLLHNENGTPPSPSSRTFSL